MKINFNQLPLLALACLAFNGCSKNDDGYQIPPQALEITAIAGDSSAIIGKLNAFRQQAGSQLNTVPGASSGRREINWDGIPANLANTNTFPVDFFGATDKTLPDTRKRGLIFTPANAALRVSDNNFADIDPAYSSQFSAFSKNKIFSSVGSNVTEFKFQVPGTDKPAYVSSFGLVFTDVDNADATTVEIYEGDRLIGKFKAPAADKKFSFVGLHTSAKITRVKITSGNKAITAGVTDNANTDLVAMDDFIYSEPKAY
ncbi:hypothetical protein KXD93_06805 [Mucilaginibacter sp. BJC16-A38]|uniref:hypothetical protein n=1 Tax=Mucilaginibacter phenanthrenivorans TaxID=1234842 RepID=UPI002157C0F3|nr:hypothetical protein [Mucilaginibacter phenanthrenivorans]MCR8557343.1 hypothetical protein [Mucilaginibacter phenanthrenivorans]